MTKEERSKYQKFATYCIRHKIPVKFGTGTYIVTAVIYRLRNRTNEELFTVELVDNNRKDSTITVGLEEFYNENCKEEQNGEDQ